MDTSKMKKQFYDVVSRIPKKANSFQMSSAKYLKLINDVKIAKSGNQKEKWHYWLLKHYDVVTVNMKEKLIVPLISDLVLYYVVFEELFDILYDTHVAIGHGGRDRMRREIHQKYKNITVQEIQTFLNLCEPCLQKRKSDKKGLVVKPMIFSHFNSRCQVDLIDFQSQADGEYKFIMVYQDHLTKFVILNALKSKQAVEVAGHLLKIFLLFGAPTILQSDNGREFVNNIIEDLKKMWPELKIVHGKPRHSQSQGSVERANQDIENILNTWMQQHQCSSWSKGLDFVQFMKNRAFHAGIKRSPYEAMFGQPARIGLTSSALPKDVIQNIITEEDLNKVLKESKLLEDQNSSQNAMPEDLPLEIELVEDNEDSNLALQNGDFVIENVFEVEEENKELELAKVCKICDAHFNSLIYTDICEVCALELKMKRSRKEAKENLEVQAKRMKTISDASHSQAEVGMTVRVKVPDVDRGRGDARSILACVVKKTEDGYFQLGTKTGIIKGLYSRSQFSVCPEPLIAIENIANEEMPLRTVANILGENKKFCR